MCMGNEGTDTDTDAEHAARDTDRDTARARDTDTATVTARDTDMTVCLSAWRTVQ